MQNMYNMQTMENMQNMETYLIFVIFLHEQNFGGIKFTNCQISALNLKKFTPAKKNLHEYIREVRDKYQVCRYQHLAPEFPKCRGSPTFISNWFLTPSFTHY